jgi:hypothetical protein
MRLQISMGVAQIWKRPPKHFYTGFAGGVQRDPAGLESYKGATSPSQNKVVQR